MCGFSISVQSHYSCSRLWCELVMQLQLDEPPRSGVALEAHPNRGLCTRSERRERNIGKFWEVRSHANTSTQTHKHARLTPPTPLHSTPLHSTPLHSTPLTHALTHPRTHSFTHSLTHPHNHSLTRSLTLLNDTSPMYP